MSTLVRPKKADYLSAIHSAIAAQKRYMINSPTRLVTDRKIARCNICNDKEYIWSTDKQAMVPCKCHAERNMERRLQKSGISIEEYKKRSIECFPTDREEAQKMKALAMNFIVNHKTGESIIYTGKSGTMKTTILMAICLELTIKYGQNHKYFSYRDEMPYLKWLMFNKADVYQDTIKELISCDNLFIDDLFKSKKSAIGRKENKAELEVTSTDAQIMFQLVNGRYINRKTTLFSSEYRLNQIVNEVDEATGTRIFEMCRNFNMTCNDINRRLMKQ